MRPESERPADFVWSKRREDDRDLHENYGLVRVNARQFVKCSRRCCNATNDNDF